MHRLSDHTIVDGAIVLSDAQLGHLAESLKGTPDSGWLEDHFDHPDFEGVNVYDLNAETLDELDAKVLRCEQCGWWYEVGEFDESPQGDVLCDDCMGML